MWNNLYKLFESLGLTKLLSQRFGYDEKTQEKIKNTFEKKSDKELSEMLPSPYDEVGKVASGVSSDLSSILGEIPNAIKDYLGVTQREHLNKADELAQQTQNFNESFSKQQLQQQAEQFAIDNATANKNIDFQKQVAEKNLALQTDVFNAQLRENELTRQREDTAMQRQVADLQAAGLSPLMVSNGASASGLQVGSAPQYDASAVATAQGSAISMAREYAQLKNMAEGQYLTRKQAAANERIGAQMALSQLGAQNKLNTQSLALQSFNIATSLRDMKKKHELIDEQIRVSKNQNNWMENHGYRNQNEWSILLPILDKLANNIGIDYDRLGEAFTNMPQTIINSIQDLSSMYDGTEEGFNKLKSKVEVLKDTHITKSSFDNLLNQLIEPEEVSDEQISSWYRSMNDSFKDKFSFGYFYDGITGKSKWKKSVLLKYFTFGNSGNI